MTNFFHTQNELAYLYLEKTVVTPGVELRGLLNVIVEGPEVLDCAEGDDGSLVLLPASVPVVFEEPQGPFVLKKSKVKGYFRKKYFDLTVVCCLC